MKKAVTGNFEFGIDFGRLEHYLQKQGCFELVSDEKRIFFPTEVKRDKERRIVSVTFDSVDNEVTKRWFKHRLTSKEFSMLIYVKLRIARIFFGKIIRIKDSVAMHAATETGK